LFGMTGLGATYDIVPIPEEMDEVKEYRSILI
jgi:hypothetical protein